MKSIQITVLALCGLLAGSLGGRAEDPKGASSGPAPEQFAHVSGAELVRELVPAATRLAALQELGHRANAALHSDVYRIDAEDDAEPETIVCPQRDGSDPLYVVLYKFLPSSIVLDGEGYPVARPAELFPPEPLQAGAPAAPAHPPLERRSEMVITVFDARGEQVIPFGGDNMLTDGVFAGFTGDGHIARADCINFGVEGVKIAQALLISAVESPTARPLLAVLYNWGDQAGWGYEFAPRTEDSTIEVRLGPVDDDEGRRVEPRVTYRWDTVHKRFAGPAGGGSGDHFLVLGTGRDLFDAVNSLKDHLPFFAGEPSRGAPASPALAPSRVITDKAMASPVPSVAAKPPAHVPVPATFLAGLSDEAILHFFDEGRNPETDAVEAMQRQSTSIALPANFWDGPPQEVALALADLNRSPEHRARYRLAVDDLDGMGPPKEGALLFDTGSSRCYRAADGINFLHFGPGDEPASLIHLSTTEAGAAFYNVVGSQPTYDLRWCALAAADARQLAAILWWLDRVRSRSRFKREGEGLEHMFSTGDGNGTLQLLPASAGSPPLRLSGMLWSGGSLTDNPNPVAARWTGNYGPETTLNLGFHLMGEVLPYRLGPEWSRFAPRDEPGIGSGAANQTPSYAADELARLHDFAARALAISPKGQIRISYALLGGIAAMAGNLGFDDLDPALHKLATQLPTATANHAGRTAETIQREMVSADPIHPDRDPSVEESPADEAAHAHWDALHKEWQGVIDGTDEPGASENLREAIHQALDQFSKARDPEALAVSAADPKAPGAIWALQQLRRLGETQRAAAVLENWLEHEPNGAIARQIFAALSELAPDQARRLAAAVPAGAADHPLYVPAFVFLAKGGAQISDEPQRRDALLKTVLDPKQTASERDGAIKALVPDENPQRYPDPEIDAGLRRLLDEPVLVTHDGYTEGYLVSAASYALARRGNGGDFERILAHLTDPGYADTMLEALARLLPRRGEEGARKLEAFLRKQLAGKTDLPVSALVYAAWLSCLRELRPEIRHLATATPEEIESERASRYGGDPVPLAGERFHVARQVAALWEDEASAVVHAKALIAFGTHYDVTGDPERRDRFAAELLRLAPALTAADRQAIGIFLDLAVKRMPSDHEPAQTSDGQPKENTLNQFVRATLGL